jgi:hypothetical protein
VRLVSSDFFARPRLHQSLASVGNYLCGSGILKLISNKPLLADQFLPNQLYRNFQSSAGILGEGLCSPKSSVGRSHGSGYRENLSDSVEHYKRGVLISQPAKRRERNKPIGTDHD